MRNIKMMALLSGVFFAALAVASIAPMKGQDQTAPQRSRRPRIKLDLSQFPIADYEAPAPSDPEELRKRRAQGKKYDNAETPMSHPSGILSSSTTAGDWEYGLESVLPAAQSSLVIIGMVTDAKAFLSNEKTGIYSEFTIQVGEVLKGDPVPLLNSDGTLTAERWGGRVRNESGHAVTYSVAGQGMPRVGQRYLFFLGRNARQDSVMGRPDTADMSRNILTAYELRAGKVYPLDSAGGRNFDDYWEIDEAIFLSEVRKVIAQLAPE